MGGLRPRPPALAATRFPARIYAPPRPVAAASPEASPRPPEPVEVVGVGSRKDAAIDFCLGSRTLSSTPVVSAVQDAGQIAELELLCVVKSADKLAASIFLKPFCFEGQRRQIEASNLIAKLQKFSNFHIVIEADSLLETEVERFLLKHWKGFNQMFWSSHNAQIKEVDPEEVGKLLKSYGEARVGFGAGYNIQFAIKQAVLHCPFLRDWRKGIEVR